VPIVTRTEQVSFSLSVEEIATAFAGMFGDEQAKFFDHIGTISSDWPGAGWCQQSYDINKNLTPKGREVIAVLARHVFDRDDI